MTKVLLLSDTHSYIDETILRYALECDVIWHAGDIGSLEVIQTLEKVKPVVAVYGNIDGGVLRSEFPKHQFFTCEGMKVFLTHIGGYPKRYASGIRELLLEKRPQLFVCGHSHILKVMYDKEYEVLHLNPGAVGKYGFHKVRTMLRFEIDKGQLKNMEIIELKK